MTIGEGQDVVNVAAENDEAAFIRAVFVYTSMFGHVWYSVENSGEGVDGFAGLGVGNNCEENLNREENLSCRRGAYEVDRHSDVYLHNLQRVHNRPVDD